jgi:hypothetical protein
MYTFAGQSMSVIIALLGKLIAVTSLQKVKVGHALWYVGIMTNATVT